MKRISKRSFLKTLLALPLGAKAALLPNSEKHQLSGDGLRICFGSCNHQDSAQDHWPVIARQNPDAWFWLGDNIYGDSPNPYILQNKYNSLLSSQYGNFRANFRVEGIWDDHDYGENGGNRNYPSKVASKQLFLDFMGVPYEDPRRAREGIYYSREYYAAGRLIKVYFLDCRYFRDPIKGTESTLLGQEQWQWLEREMSSSYADVNLFVSPIGVLLNRTFVSEDWLEYPNERVNLLELINKCRLSGAFFLSGDKHFGAAIGKKILHSDQRRTMYYEFQSSGLTHAHKGLVMGAVRAIYGRSNTIVTRNFGQIDFFEWNGQLHMRWTLHSLTRSNLKLIRNFKLDNQAWTIF